VHRKQHPGAPLTCAVSTQMPAPARDVRICFFGDSFLNGTLDQSYLGWPGRVCSALPHQVTHYNLGIRGDTARDIEQRWEDEAARRWKLGTESRLFFSFGTNDASLENGAPRLAPDESVRSARNILRRAKRIAPVLFSGPPAAELEARDAAFARLAQLSQRYAELAASLDLPYLDLFALTRHSEDWHGAVRRGDGVHPDTSGYAVLARCVSDWDAWQAWW
jgi:acyl-CoA thioesterase-1